MTIDDLLRSYREIFAMSELEKGERFERLMRNFLLTYPVWRGIVSDVWHWRNFPFRQEFGGRDLGIDLVVKTIEESTSTAELAEILKTTCDEKIKFILLTNAPLRIRRPELKKFFHSRERSRLSNLGH